MPVKVYECRPFAHSDAAIGATPSYRVNRVVIDVGETHGEFKRLHDRFYHDARNHANLVLAGRQVAGALVNLLQPKMASFGATLEAGGKSAGAARESYVARSRRWGRLRLIRWNAGESVVTEMHLPFNLENDLEQRIADDPAWRQGVEWGRPRHGHPEGTIKAHVAAVLVNVDSFYVDSPLRERLRLIALCHDTFKYQVDMDRPRTGENHHAMRARRFAERFVDDQAVLDVIETHDEAFNAWQLGNRDGKWDKACTRAERLIQRLGDSVMLYLAFYHCDNTTEGKDAACLEWFRALCGNQQSRDNH